MCLERGEKEPETRRKTRDKKGKRKGEGIALKRGERCGISESTRKWKCYLFNCVRLFVSPWAVAMDRLLCPWNSSGKHTGVSCHSLLRGILSTQGSNPGLLPGRQILYHLIHQGSLLAILKTAPTAQQVCVGQNATNTLSMKHGIHRQVRAFLKGLKSRQNRK